MMPVFANILERLFNKTALALCLFSLFIFVTPAKALPSTLGYSGTVYVNDEPYTGTGFFKIAIVSESGQTIWSNDGTSSNGSEPRGDVEVTVNSGVYSIMLGDSNTEPLTPSIFNTTEKLYIRTWFDDGENGFSKFEPDIKLSNSISSFVAQTLQGYVPEDFLSADTPIEASQISDGAVTNSKISAFSDSGKTFSIGNSSDANVGLTAKISSSTTLPGIRYNVSSDQWEFSNDGSTYSAFGSGSGSGDITGVIASTGLSGGGLSGDTTLTIDQNFAPTWTNAHAFTFAGTENLSLTSDLGGSVNVFSIIATPSSTAGTTQGLLVQQADSANTNGLDSGLVFNNADADLAMTNAIQITNSGGGGFTKFLDTPSIDISGTGAITGATGITSSGTLTASDYISCTALTTDASGIVQCSTAVAGSGDVTALIAGAGLTGGASSGDATVDVGAGTGITVNANDIALNQAVAPTWTSQHIFTRDPTDTTTASASVRINPATSAANEKYLALQDNGADVFTVDKEGDVLAIGTIASTFSGNLTGNVTGNVTGDLTGNVTGNVTGNASTATALAANPSDCGAGAVAVSIDASGNLTCAAVSTTELTNDSITASDLAATLTFAAGDLVDLSASTNAGKGLKLPQATDVSALTAEGLLSWDSDDDRLYVGDGAAVKLISNPFGNAIDSTEITNGDIANVDISATAAIDFSKLATLTSGNILVGNASNAAASVAMSGDVTIDNAGATAIAANAVTLTTDTTGNYVASVATTSPLSGGAAGSEGGALTLSISADGIGPTQIDETANYNWSGTSTFSKVNGAGASAAGVTLSGTVGAMDGSDTFRGLYLNYADADHSGASNAVIGLDIAGITADAEAIETAIKLGDGWDVGLDLGNNSLKTGATAITGTELSYLSGVTSNIQTQINAAGDITSVVAGDGLTGGSASGAATVDIGAGNGISVNANDVAVNFAYAPTWTAQHIFTRDPSDTTSANASLKINPATSAANEKYLALQDNGTDVFTVDKEGDVVALGTVAATFSGNLTGNVTGNLTGNASTATALAGNPSDCGAGSVAVSIDASGNLTCASVTATEITDNTVTATDLAATLTFSDGDLLDLSSINASGTAEGLKLPQANDVSAATAEGQLSWDKDDDTLYIGTGSGITAITSGSGDVTAVGDVASGAAFTATAGDDGNSLYFEGATVDGNEIRLTGADPGADVTVTIPATTGTLVTTGDTGTVSTTMILDDTVSLTTDTAGNYVATITAGNGLTGDVSSEGSTPTLAVGAGTGIVANANDIAVNQATNFAWTGAHTHTQTVTATGAIDSIALTLGDDADVDTVSGLSIATTSANTGDADVVYGINVGDLAAADATALETAINIGTGWDKSLTAAGTIETPTLTLTGTGTLNGLDAIDATGETTLEAALDIAGDVTGTGLGSVVIADNAVDGTDIALGSDAAGDVMYYDGTNYVRLAKGSDGDVLTLASGLPSWAAVAGSGDVTAVGNCASGDCFGGATGTTLTSTTGEVLNMATANTFIYARNDAGTVTFMGKDDDADATTIYDTSGAGSITVGSADVTAVTVTTDGTGDAEVVLPDGSVSGTEILNDTVALTTDTSGNYVATITAGNGLTGDVSSEGATPTLAVGAGTGITANANDIAVNQATNFAWTGAHTYTQTVTASGAIDSIAITLGDDADVDTVSALSIAATSENTGDADIVYGINVGNLSLADATVSETAINIGTGWDKSLTASGTIETPTLTLTGTGTLNGLDAIDATGETTLEAALDIAGDVTGTGLGAVMIADNAVDGTDIALGSDASGDVMYYDGTNYVRLAKGSDGDVLTLASGLPSWVAGTTGDVTAVGNCASGDCFGGVTGTTLTSTTGEVLNMATANTLLYVRDDAGTVTFMGKDDDATATTIYDTSGAGTITVGSADVTAITLTTDGTGDAEVVLPTGSVSTGEILDATIATGDIAADTIVAGNIATGGVATTEILDNTITATDIAATVTFADSDLVDLSAINASSTTEGLKLPQATDVSAATAEGLISWDTDGDTLYVGDGAAVKAIGNPFGASIDTGEITDGTVATGDIAADTIDFTNLADSMTLDAATSIGITTTNRLTFNNSGTGTTVPFIMSATSADTTKNIGLVMTDDDVTNYNLTAAVTQNFDIPTHAFFYAGIDKTGTGGAFLAGMTEVDTSAGMNLVSITKDAGASAEGLDVMVLNMTGDDTFAAWPSTARAFAVVDGAGGSSFFKVLGNGETLLGSSSSGGTAGKLTLYDGDAASTPESISFSPPPGASLTTGYTLTLPVDDGTANQFLMTDGTGVTSWSSVATANITADTIDFTNIADSMTLDASTTVNLGAAQSFTFDAAATDSTLSGTGSVNIVVDAASTTSDNTNLSTFQSAQTIDVENIDNNTINGAVIGQTIAVTNSSDDSGDDVMGLLIKNTAASTSGMHQMALIYNLDDDTTVDNGLSVASATNNKIVTGVDVSDSNLTNSISVGANPIITGNVAGTIGDSSTDSWTFTTDGTGDAEIVLPDGSISTSEILDNTITTSDIGTGGVAADEIASDAVGSDEIATGAVGTDEIANGSIASTDLDLSMSPTWTGVHTFNYSGASDAVVISSSSTASSASALNVSKSGNNQPDYSPGHGAKIAISGSSTNADPYAYGMYLANSYDASASSDGYGYNYGINIYDTGHIKNGYMYGFYSVTSGTVDADSYGESQGAYIGNSSNHTTNNTTAKYGLYVSNTAGSNISHYVSSSYALNVTQSDRASTSYGLKLSSDFYSDDAGDTLLTMSSNYGGYITASPYGSRLTLSNNYGLSISAAPTTWGGTTSGNYGLTVSASPSDSTNTHTITSNYGSTFTASPSGSSLTVGTNTGMSLTAGPTTYGGTISNNYGLNLSASSSSSSAVLITNNYGAKIYATPGGSGLRVSSTNTALDLSASFTFYGGDTTSNYGINLAASPGNSSASSATTLTNNYGIKLTASPSGSKFGATTNAGLDVTASPTSYGVATTTNYGMLLVASPSNSTGAYTMANNYGQKITANPTGTQISLTNNYGVDIAASPTATGGTVTSNTGLNIVTSPSTSTAVTFTNNYGQKIVSSPANTGVTIGTANYGLDVTASPTASAATIPANYGINVAASPNPSSRTVTANYGIYVSTVPGASATAITTNYGGYISAAAASTNTTANYGLRIAATGGTSNYPLVVDPPAIQVVAGTNTIKADACGTIKRINSVGAVTTSTTNTFTNAAPAGCCMDVINVDTADAITLDFNANFKSAGGVDVVLGINDTARVCSDGTVWYQVGATGNN